MKNINRFILSLSALLIASGLALAAPAGAEQSSGNVSGKPPIYPVPIAADQSDTSSSADSNSSSSSLAQQFKEQAQQKLQAEKQNLKQHTEAEREQACTARKANLAKRMSNAVTEAKKHKQVFDNIYTKVKAFHDSKNLNVTDYASLIAAADTAGTNAQASIDALSALDVNVDCTSQTVSVSVSTFQQAVKSTRDSLKDHRAAIVKVIEALKGASTSSDNSSTNTAAQ